MDQQNNVRIDVVGSVDGLKGTAAEAERDLDRLKTAAASAGTGMREGAAAGDLLRVAGGAVASAAMAASGGMAAWAAAQVAATFAIKDTADEVGKMSQRMGESIASVSELRHIFDMAGASSGEMAQMMKSLESKAQDAAKGTGQAAAAYKAMGVEVMGTNGELKDGRVLLEEVADRIASYRDGAAKAALVQDALGGSWVKMIPLLNGGAEGFREAAKEAHDLGVVFDEQLTKQSADLNDNLTRIKTAAEGAKIALGSELMPTIVRLSEEFVQGIKAAGGFWAALSMGATLNPFKSNLDNIQTVRGDLAKMEADQKEYGYLDEQRWNRKQAQLKYLLAMQGEADRRGLAALSDGLPTTPDKRPNAPTPQGRPENPAKADDSAFKERLRQLRDEAAAEAALISMRQKADDLLASYGRQDAVAVQRIARSAELASMTERERTVAEAVYAAQDKSATRQEQIIKQISDETERTRALTLEKNQLAAHIEKVTAAAAKSYDDQRSFEFGWNKSLQRFQDDAGNAAKSAEAVFGNAAEGMTNALTQLSMSGKVSFSGLANSIISDILRMQARAAVSGLMGFVSSTFNAYMGSPSSSGPSAAAGGGSWLGGGQSLNMNALGGVYAATSLSSYSGTVVSKPTIFPFAKGAGLMGEAGAEGIFPLKRGRDGKLGVSAEGTGANVTVIVNNQSGGQASTQERSDGRGNKIIEVLIDQVKSSLAGDVGSGNGAFPAAMERSYGLSRKAGAY